MCFFVEINLAREELKKRFNVPALNDPRYMPAYLHSAFNRPFLPIITSQQPEIIQFYQWGLVPFWTRNEIQAVNIRNSTYNAKSETLWEKPSFRASARYRRCMVLVHGFFEYQTSGKQKIPYYIYLKNNEAFALAGIYEDWTNPATSEIFHTLSIITTEANPLMAKIHNSKKRMPVILPKYSEKEWISNESDIQQLKSLLVPFNENQMKAHPVSREIIKKDLDITNPEIIKPYDYSNSDLSLF